MLLSLIREDMSTTISAVRHHMFVQRYLYLFITLLLPYILHPLIETETLGIGIMDVAFSLVLIVALFAVSTQQHVRNVALVLMIVAQMLIWSNIVFHGYAHRLVSLGVSCFYLIYTTVFVLRRILYRSDVNSNTIFASLCVYLMLGYIWAFFYSILEVVAPGSFAVDHEVFSYPLGQGHVYDELYYFMYYSFTSITTLGLGDIMPASPWARVLTVLEAIVGQIYLVVLVSRLVGMHISQRIDHSR